MNVFQIRKQNVLQVISKNMDKKHKSDPYDTNQRIHQRYRQTTASMDSISNSVSEQSASFPMNDSSSEKDTGSPSKSLCSSASSSSENVQAHEMRVSNHILHFCNDIQFEFIRNLGSLLECLLFRIFIKVYILYWL